MDLHHVFPAFESLHRYCSAVKRRQIRLLKTQNWFFSFQKSDSKTLSFLRVQWGMSATLQSLGLQEKKSAALLKRRSDYRGSCSMAGCWPTARLSSQSSPRRQPARFPAQHRCLSTGLVLRCDDWGRIHRSSTATRAMIVDQTQYQWGPTSLPNLSLVNIRPDLCWGASWRIIWPLNWIGRQPDGARRRENENQCHCHITEMLLLFKACLELCFLILWSNFFLLSRSLYLISSSTLLNFQCIDLEPKYSEKCDLLLFFHDFIPFWSNFIWCFCAIMNSLSIKISYDSEYWNDSIGSKS